MTINWNVNFPFGVSTMYAMAQKHIEAFTKQNEKKDKKGWEEKKHKTDNNYKHM